MTDLLLDGASALVLGLETADQLPHMAAEALAEGADSAALRVLAAMHAPRLEEALPVLEGALREAGRSMPTPRAAALQLARKTARRMLQGQISAYEGSRQIWHMARCVTSESVNDLDPFIYAASEWEDRPEDRPFLEDAMLCAARELTRGDGPNGGGGAA